MENTLDKFMRVLDIGISHGSVFTGSCEELTAFKECLMGELHKRSVNVILVDLSGTCQFDASGIDVLDPQDLILVWGLEYLSPQENRAYSLRTALDITKHGGPRFAIFCENDRYAEHFSDYNAPFYHFCPRFPVIVGSGLNAK